MYNAAKFDTVLIVIKVTMIKVNYDKSYEDESQEIFLDNIGISKQG